MDQVIISFSFLAAQEKECKEKNKYEKSWHQKAGSMCEDEWRLKFRLAGDASCLELPRSMARRFRVELSLFQLDLDGCELARVVNAAQTEK